jgi:hypothetical protein
LSEILSLFVILQLWFLTLPSAGHSSLGDDFIGILPVGIEQEFFRTPLLFMMYQIEQRGA